MLSEGLRRELDSVAHKVRAEVLAEQAPLTELKLDAMEEQAVAVGDELTRQLLRLFLTDQAQQLANSPQVCPRCSGPLQQKLAQGQPLLTRRGRVHWKQPVAYCPACRRDFFPSSQGGRVRGRSGRESGGAAEDRGGSHRL